MCVMHVRAKGLLLCCLFALGALAGCGGGAGGPVGGAAAGASAGPPVPAPTLAVGDRWQYRITDNLRRGAVTMLDAQVVSIANGVATLRLVYTDQRGPSERTEEIDASGGLVLGSLKEELTRRFPTPIELYDFPLQAGTSWRQTVNTTSPDTGLPAQILVYGTVQASSQVSVPAGSYDTIYLFRVIQLDDEQFWRSRTDRRDFVWYAPQVKTAVRETHDASYVLRGGGALSVVRTENTTRDLVSFQPGTR
ncbi:MAG TPA: hypothetical protein VMM27_05520 [Casimicrobiaceae bacterium]|nr:hypothetical protein [Casimicrobiaceae bacterium]